MNYQSTESSLHKFGVGAQKSVGAQPLLHPHLLLESPENQNPASTIMTGATMQPSLESVPTDEPLLGDRRCINGQAGICTALVTAYTSACSCRGIAKQCSSHIIIHDYTKPEHWKLRET